MIANLLHGVGVQMHMRRRTKVLWAGVCVLVALWLLSYWLPLKWMGSTTELGIGRGEIWMSVRVEPPASLFPGNKTISDDFDLPGAPATAPLPPLEMRRIVWAPLWLFPVALVVFVATVRWITVPPPVFYLPMRICRWLWRSAAALTIGLGLLWWLSLNMSLAWSAKKELVLEVSSGAVVVCWERSPTRLEPGFHVNPARERVHTWFKRQRTSGYEIVIVPLLLAAIAPASLALGAWGLETIIARGRRGKCITCGYSRTGLNAETPCPECGALATGKGTAGTPKSSAGARTHDR
ncbi:MAG: hypothetical protein KF691_01245 [Phycisphaeraceae bacterium]|nr:hypothetical protein [Phycisphaeraceae bacterium]